MQISFLCSDSAHPVNEYLLEWIERNKSLHSIELVRNKGDLSGGAILFLISCSEIVNKTDRSSYLVSLVIHASDLPNGRGWSPHIWQIIEGRSEITLSLLEAEDKVDSGRIWKKIKLKIPKYILWDEINALLFTGEIDLINYAVEKFDDVTPQQQDKNIEPSYYPKRTPLDSQIDPLASLESQFDKIRVCDPSRFPAFFELNGHKYTIKLEKVNE